jgi:predicted small metal-binding protein
MATGERREEISMKYCHFHCNPGSIILNCEMLAAAYEEQELFLI